MIVVGSPNSSNSNRLREVAANRGVPAYMVDRADELDPEWVAGAKRVGVTAGASAPEVLVREVIERLRGARRAERARARRRRREGRVPDAEGAGGGEQESGNRGDALARDNTPAAYWRWNAMKTIRWGMIGCGDVAEIKSGPGFYKAANSTLVAVMRRNGKLAEDFARRHGVPRWHDDADAIIRRERHRRGLHRHADEHASRVHAALRGGRQAGLRRKADGDEPCAMPSRWSLRVARPRVPLWVGYYRRALPRFLAVRDLLAGGAIGDVRAVTSRDSSRACRRKRY